MPFAARPHALLARAALVAITTAPTFTSPQPRIQSPYTDPQTITPQAPHFSPKVIYATLASFLFRDPTTIRGNEYTTLCTASKSANKKTISQKSPYTQIQTSKPHTTLILSQMRLNTILAKGNHLGETTLLLLGSHT